MQILSECVLVRGIRYHGRIRIGQHLVADHVHLTEAQLQLQRVVEDLQIGKL